MKKGQPDLDGLIPKLGWSPMEVIKKTLHATTQNARMDNRTRLRHHYRSRFPALNVHCRNEPVATDTIYSDTPAIDNGSKIAQFFVGRNSLVSDVYGIKSEKEFVNTLEDNIRYRGAMDKLISDRAQVEISKKVNDILRNYRIEDWQSEPHHQHQNFAERRYQMVKSYVNLIMNRTGAIPSTWLLCLQYVCFLLNHLASELLNWRTPIEVLSGSTPDLSPLMQYHFWEPVYYLIDDKQKFPSETVEKFGRFVGISENVGDAMTFKVLTDDTNQVIHRSSLRSAADQDTKNKRLKPDKDPKEPIMFIKSAHGDEDDLGRLPDFSPDDLIGRTFVRDIEGKSTEFKVERKIVDQSDNSETTSFLVTSDELDEIIAYNNLLDYVEKVSDVPQDPEEQTYTFKDITAHQGPLKKGDLAWKGSNNVLVKWGTEETLYEPLHLIAQDDPVTCSKYVKRNGLLHLQGWRQSREKVMIYFKDNSKFIIYDQRSISSGFHKAYIVKHDRCHKARLVAGGHLTDEPEDNVYSGVVSLRSLRLDIFLVEPNDLEIYQGDRENQHCRRTMMAFSNTMRDMNFLACKEDGDAWSLDEREAENKVEVED